MDKLNPSLVKILNVLGIKQLNHLQQLASDEGLFSTSENIALVSQSRTGKSFAGALMVANELYNLKEKEMESKDTQTEEKIAIFITPFHTSARDFYSIISKYFGWFLKPFVVLEETRKTELIFRISKGTPPNVLIASPESMQKLLRREESRKWFLERSLSTIVFDDVHSILFDPTRGPKLFEVASFFLNKITPKPRVLALSAQFDNPERLQSLFKLDKVIEDTKKYKSPNIDLINYESPKEKRDEIADLLTNLADDGTRTLIFMSRIDEINTLFQQHSEILEQSVSYDIDYIVKERLERVAKILLELNYPESSCVQNGIGINHALMSETERWYIEWAFRRKYIRFLFGTQALAYGVNTPVEHVIMASPGNDEIFRQSMLSRAVWMRRGKGKPGECTVYSKSITEVEELERTFSLPEMPVRTARGSSTSNYLLGRIGLGTFTNESSTDDIKQELKLFFKWTQIPQTLKKLIKADFPLVIKDDDGTLHLTKLGNIAFENTLSREKTEKIIEGIKILASIKEKPTEFDLLLILNHAALREGGKAKSKKKIKDELRNSLEENVVSPLLTEIINQEKEVAWNKAVEYSALAYTSIKEDLDFEVKSRKQTARLFEDLKNFSLNFKGFLEGIAKEKALGNEKAIQSTIKELIRLIESKQFKTIIQKTSSGKERSLKGEDLSFVDFGEIERTIDETLDSNLSPLQKIQLIELLESVESTTSAFVELMKKSNNDPEAAAVLKKVCSLSSESHVGKNLMKALIEEGAVEGNIMDQLRKKYSGTIEEITKKAKAPKAATKVLYNIFTGNLVGATMGTLDLAKTFIGKSKIDTSGIS